MVTKTSTETTSAQVMSKEVPTFTVKRTITGLGLFTLKPFSEGKRIIEYTGKIISSDDKKEMSGRYLFEISEKLAINGKTRTNLARYINHSCRPNAIAYLSGRRVWIWAKRNIKAGEPITIDYGKRYFDDYIRPIGCKCEKCVKKLNGSSGKVASRQRD
jgi:SET domain-containing protein